MNKRRILWAVVIVVAYVSGFGVGAVLWKYSAAHEVKELLHQRLALQMVLADQLGGRPGYVGEMTGEVRESSPLI